MPKLEVLEPYFYLYKKSAIEILKTHKRQNFDAEKLWFSEKKNECINNCISYPHAWAVENN